MHWLIAFHLPAHAQIMDEKMLVQVVLELHHRDSVKPVVTRTLLYLEEYFISVVSVYNGCALIFQ